MGAAFYRYATVGYTYTGRLKLQNQLFVVYCKKFIYG